MFALSQLRMLQAIGATALHVSRAIPAVLYRRLVLGKPRVKEWPFLSALGSARLDRSSGVEIGGAEEMGCNLITDFSSTVGCEPTRALYPDTFWLHLLLSEPKLISPAIGCFCSSALAFSQFGLG